MSARPVGNGFRAKALEPRHAQHQRAGVTRTRHRRHERRLAGRAAAPLAATALAAPERIVDLG